MRKSIKQMSRQSPHALHGRSVPVGGANTKSGATSLSRECGGLIRCRRESRGRYGCSTPATVNVDSGLLVTPAEQKCSGRTR